MSVALERKISYNRVQAQKFDWSPNLFGAFKFDEDLITKITQFQLDHDLSGDGMCGPLTYRRALAHHEIEKDEEASKPVTFDGTPKYIIHDGREVPIYWEKVILWTEEGAYGSRKGNYTNRMGKPTRQPKMFVTHWDAALSSKSCAQILWKRGLSIHFCIGSKGEIWQLLDTQNIAWHAGKANSHSIGVEVCDPYYLKYNEYYKKRGLPERPIWSGKYVHGKKLKPFLGFTDKQIDALAALWEATSRACGIPLETPPGAAGVHPAAAENKYNGYVCHYHLTSRKIDCAGLDMELVLAKARAIRGK